jgi:hypothetical protein
VDSLFKLLPALVRASADVPEVAEAAAFAAWRRVAGEGLRTQAVPFRLFRKTLVVAVADATWQRHLEPSSAQLLFRINSLLGQAMVTYIEFRIDPQTVNKERARLGHQSLADAQKSEERALERAGNELSGEASAIQDEDLRRRFLIAAGSCMNAVDDK